MVGIQSSLHHNQATSGETRAQARRTPRSGSQEQFDRGLKKTSALLKNAGRVVGLAEEVEELLSGVNEEISYQNREGLQQRQGLVRLDLVEDSTKQIETLLRKIQSTDGLEGIARALPSDLDIILRSSLGSLQESLAVARRLDHFDQKVNSDLAYQLSPKFDDHALKRGSRDFLLWQSVNAIEHAVNRAKKVIQRAEARLQDDLKSSDEMRPRLEAIQIKLDDNKSGLMSKKKETNFLEKIRPALQRSLDLAQNYLTPEEQIKDLSISDLDLATLESNLPDTFSTINNQAEKNSQEIQKRIPEFEMQSESILASLVENQESLDFIRSWTTKGAELQDTVGAGMDPGDRPDLLELTLETLRSLEEAYPEITTLTGLNELRDLDSVEQALSSEQRKAGLIYGRKDSGEENPWTDVKVVEDKLQVLSQRFKALPSQILGTYSFLNSLRNRKGINAQWRKHLDSDSSRKLHQIVAPAVDNRKPGPRKFHGRIHALISDLSVLIRTEEGEAESRTADTSDLLDTLNSIIESRVPGVAGGLIRTKDIPKIVNSIHQLEEISEMPRAAELQEQFIQARQGLIQALPEGTEISRKKNARAIPDEIGDLLSGIEESVFQDEYANLALKVSYLNRLKEATELSRSARVNIFQRASNVYNRLLEASDDLPSSEVLTNLNILIDSLKEGLQTQQKAKPKRVQGPGRATNSKRVTPGNKELEESKGSHDARVAQRLISNFTSFLTKLIQASRKKLKFAVKGIRFNLKDILSTIEIKPELAKYALPALQEAERVFKQEHQSQSRHRDVKIMEKSFVEAIKRTQESIQELAA